MFNSVKSKATKLGQLIPVERELTTCSGTPQLSMWVLPHPGPAVRTGVTQQTSPCPFRPEEMSASAAWEEGFRLEGKLGTTLSTPHFGQTRN